MLKEVLGISILHVNLKTKYKVLVASVAVRVQPGQPLPLSLWEEVHAPLFLVKSFEHRAQICLHCHSDTQIIWALKDTEKY